MLFVKCAKNTRFVKRKNYSNKELTLAAKIKINAKKGALNAPLKSINDFILKIRELLRNTPLAEIFLQIRNESLLSAC